ncbi:MAG: hypothetical protein IIB60_03375 [Planctomycetes bacterium]|nr:hypothetical protein [Planctomycetota bacterium]
MAHGFLAPRLDAASGEPSQDLPPALLDAFVWTADISMERATLDYE